MNALVGLRVSQCGKNSMSKEKEIEDFLKSLRDVATNVTDGRRLAETGRHAEIDLGPGVTARPFSRRHADYARRHRGCG